MEATGRREYDLLLTAAERGLPVVVIQPLTVRRFVGTCGVLA
jgi:transposase